MMIGDCVVTTVNPDTLLSRIKVNCLVARLSYLILQVIHKGKSELQRKSWVTVWNWVKTFLETSWRHSRELEVRLHTFLTSAIDGWQWSASSPRRFIIGVRFCSSVRTEGWAGLTAEIDISKIGEKSLWHNLQLNIKQLVHRYLETP